MPQAVSELEIYLTNYKTDIAMHSESQTYFLLLASSELFNSMVFEVFIQIQFRIIVSDNCCRMCCRIQTKPNVP